MADYLTKSALPEVVSAVFCNHIQQTAHKHNLFNYGNSRKLARAMCMLWARSAGLCLQEKRFCSVWRLSEYGAHRPVTFDPLIAAESTPTGVASRLPHHLNALPVAAPSPTRCSLIPLVSLQVYLLRTRGLHWCQRLDLLLLSCVGTVQTPCVHFEFYRSAHHICPIYMPTV